MQFPHLLRSTIVADCAHFAFAQNQAVLKVAQTHFGGGHSTRDPTDLVGLFVNLWMK